MDRRSVIMGMAAAFAAAPVRADEPGLTFGAGQPFSVDDLLARARRMATQPHAPGPEIPQPWRDLSYDQYRMIWFDGRNALWRDGQAPVQVDLFPPGLFYRRPVDIAVVEDGIARPVRFDMGVFDRTDRFPDLPIDDTLGYSGLRLRAEIEKPGIFQEFAVFQGASYFRGIGTGQIYGLSARGLAIDTAEPTGEEFPEFTAFWIERPAKGADTTVIHALLDSPRATGIYSFRIRPGAVLRMDVTARLFARAELRHVGLGPLTSMFLFDETMRERFSDFRPAVHDSDGLLIHNGAGEAIWRPLSNPRELQISAFLDDGPQGFGLMQRARAFGDFADLEALYHRRPGLWITPDGDWGRGSVTLVEIPADREVYDNIVAYWRPARPLAASDELSFGYSMSWGADPAPARDLARVTNTRMGRHMQGDDFVVTVDFEPHPALAGDLSAIGHMVRSSAGSTTKGVLQRNPDTGGPRLAFRFTPGGAGLAELRVQLRDGDRPLSEAWLYRWTS
ncbi:glucan biosynthesis protein G [Paracoccus sp. 1_MG-2023]|uniref:glucan biosynthesis protein n=1 Tax=unclassified Paracoccus (in: a-proteobacteria) TaxID=2688777 RepID=UPI001C09B889|nr:MULTISPECIES: glucan biosynthesis protein G [unclassified Paracoccus (in: a-proteobacteria)]MBU2957661.1 glucan biosynthesis protein G [Paracoccus sp. C2R09]MDO6667491.1 glucan biosynthesis protein G [Paracoccus sp. 1_MG-2023]